MEQRVDPRSESQQRASANHGCQPCLVGERELSPLQPRQLVWRDYSRRSWCWGAEWGFTPDRRPCWSDRTRLRLSWSFSYLKPPAGGKLKQAQIQKIYIYGLIKGIEKMRGDALSMQAMPRVRCCNKNTIRRLIQNPHFSAEGPSKTHPSHKKKPVDSRVLNTQKTQSARILPFSWISARQEINDSF